MLVEKNRHGAQFANIHMRWVGETQKLWDMTESERHNAPCCAKDKRYSYVDEEDE